MTKGYRHLTNKEDWSFGCPDGSWRGRLDQKAWGDRGNLMLFFSDETTGEKYWFSVFWTNRYHPKDGGHDFKNDAESGDVFELETEKTKSGSPKLLSARKISSASVRLLSSDVTLEDLGRIPGMLDVSNPAPARDQFNANYQHGGGWRPRDKFTLGDDDSLGYPGDEPLHPLAEITFRDERVLIYESNFVAVIQPDRSFEVCRMD